MLKPIVQDYNRYIIVVITITNSKLITVTHSKFTNYLIPKIIAIPTTTGPFETKSGIDSRALSFILVTAIIHYINLFIVITTSHLFTNHGPYLVLLFNYYYLLARSNLKGFP